MSGGKVSTLLILILFRSWTLTHCDLDVKEVCIVPDGKSQFPFSCETLTLDQFCSSGVPDNVLINILGGTHKLNTVCEMRNTSNVTFRGKSGSKVVIECDTFKDSGLRSLNVSELKLSNMEFRGCGTVHHYYEVTPQPAGYNMPGNISAALLFLNGSHLTLTNVTIADSKSSAFYIQNVAGDVMLDFCTVSNTTTLNRTVVGGNAIFYNSLVTAAVMVTITNCLIERSGSWLEISGAPNYYSGGLVLVLGSSNLTLDIVNTTFSRNRSVGKAGNGGNLAVYFYASASVTIAGTLFSEGHTNQLGGGMYVEFNTGGLYVGVNALLTSESEQSLFEPSLNIIDCTFVNNSASLYGGGAYLTWLQSKLLRGNASIIISGSLFRANSVGTKGGGLALQVQAFLNPFLPKQLPVLFTDITVSKCDFTGHYPDSSSNNLHLSENSVIYIRATPYIEMNGVVIKSNNCTAIRAEDSEIVFSGFSLISNNTAVIGGGLQMTNSVIDLLTPHTNVAIADNFAQQTGGGIQVHANPDCTSYIDRICFILLRYTTYRTVNFTVINNRAVEAGDNIFGISMKSCNREWKNVYSLHIPPNCVSRPSSISSNPQNVCFGLPVHSVCDASFNVTPGNGICDNGYNVTVYPGEKVFLPVYLSGESGGTISGTVLATSKGDLTIANDEILQRVEKLGANVTYTIYSTKSHVNGGVSLKLQAVSYDCSVRYFPPRAEVHIIFAPCPFAFKNAVIDGFDNAFKCQCNSDPLITNCSIESETITKRKYSWVGVFDRDNHSYLATDENCPLDYCNQNILNITSLPNTLIQNEQCQYNRTGVLCGACPTGWSLVLGSSECRKSCSNVWLLLIALFAVAGLLLILVIHFLNLTVTMGTVCGVIFYANIIQDYSVNIFSKHRPIPGLTPTLQVFLSWLNLDLGISTCFYDGMEAFGKTMFLFVFPIYIWMISATIIVLSNRYIFFTRLVGENALKVLSTLILLSYSKMLRVTIQVLKMKTIDVHFNSSTSTSLVRWALDGNIPYFDLQRHLFLFAIAILATLLLLPFTVSLLCIKHIFSLSRFCKVFRCIDKIKPFFDTYTGPYKDKARFWTGLLLLVRLLLLMVHSLDYKNSTVPYYIIVGICISLLAIMVLLQGVYNRHCISVLDNFFITNMCLLFLVNIYKDSSEKWTFVASHILVGLAFLVFLAIAVYHAYLKCSGYAWMKVFKFRNADIDIDTHIFDSMRGFEPIQH